MNNTNEIRYNSFGTWPEGCAGNETTVDYAVVKSYSSQLLRSNKYFKISLSGDVFVKEWTDLSEFFIGIYRIRRNI